MPYTLSFSVQPEYLEVDMSVQVEEGLELREAFERWKEVAALCREHDRTRVLVTMVFEGEYSLELKFRLAKGASAIGWSPDLKLAVVIADPQQFERQLFTETAMVSLGYEMKLFTKKKPAKKWLLQ
ncbi:hypothetical protein OZ410_13790 [Robiginitalea sp. M366]|uniref:hypothetical protein n=1 Tax=Robiginitalea aestuariiviva TaxID=3036903 RepID=UPI00240D2F0E|nr:hypothetical protein [Robiginitalea aestuariiviva]MDG1573397.1 hypothetical protein [Robiginitalea aestuariiviva]